jgi:hypothetical protein
VTKSHDKIGRTDTQTDCTTQPKKHQIYEFLPIVLMLAINTLMRLKPQAAVNVFGNN